jgi:hypothetical protein
MHTTGTSELHNFQVNHVALSLQAMGHISQHTGSLSVAFTKNLGQNAATPPALWKISWFDHVPNAWQAFCIIEDYIADYIVNHHIKLTKVKQHPIEGSCLSVHQHTHKAIKIMWWYCSQISTSLAAYLSSQSLHRSWMNLMMPMSLLVNWWSGDNASHAL